MPLHEQRLETKEKIEETLGSRVHRKQEERKKGKEGRRKGRKEERKEKTTQLP